jgi:hypothetical protein
MMKKPSFDLEYAQSHRAEFERYRLCGMTHYNPLIFQKIQDGELFEITNINDIIDLDRYYYEDIDEWIRSALSGASLLSVLLHTWRLYQLLQNDSKDNPYYSQFMGFSGLFGSCGIYLRENSDKALKLEYTYQSSFGLILPQSASANAPIFIPFVENDEYLNGVIQPDGIKNQSSNEKLFRRIPGAPNDLLVKVFNGREKVDMTQVSKYGPGNPFKEIITGDIKDTTFYFAVKCTEEGEFNTLWKNKIPVTEEVKCLDLIAKISVKNELMIRLQFKDSRKYDDITPLNLPHCSKSSKTGKKPSSRWAALLRALYGSEITPKDRYNINQSFHEKYSITDSIFDECGKLKFPVEISGTDSYRKETRRNADFDDQRFLGHWDGIHPETQNEEEEKIEDDS